MTTIDEIFKYEEILANVRKKEMGLLNDLCSIIKELRVVRRFQRMVNARKNRLMKMNRWVGCKPHATCAIYMGVPLTMRKVERTVPAARSTETLINDSNSN